MDKSNWRRWGVVGYDSPHGKFGVTIDPHGVTIAEFDEYLPKVIEHLRREFTFARQEIEMAEARREAK